MAFSIPHWQARNTDLRILPGRYKRISTVNLNFSFQWLNKHFNDVFDSQIRLLLCLEIISKLHGAAY
jgi:hypothetical protein